ncbi:hypothetical protein [Lichenifustis flavocetrariae]|uniref:Uncharacterized protein n=1 Tax=Lichenifustis flavocetrariae TaxID=2949735 RepID=A0AA42CJ66_9HYPH|nr:hypothetical protein [Lichenifustis flavocetrariae]MCW6509124.1 hypothetical protein [Lichenifustis flavocetrariae]
MKALRFVLLGLALALFAGLGWRLSHVESTPVRPVASVAKPLGATKPDLATARELVLSRMGDAPDYTPFYDRLRVEFPAEFASLIDKAAAATAKSGHPPNPERLLTEALRNLRQTRGVLAAKAEAEPLGEVFSAQSAMLDTLASQNAAVCTDFLYGGSSPGFMAFSATHRALLERIAMAALNAITSGRDKPVDRDEPSGEDFDRLTEALKAQHLSDDQISALLDGKSFDPPLPESQMCDAGRIYLHVLNDMPEDLRLRVYALSAQLLARS